MKMTDAQAAAYCASRALVSLDLSGGPSGEEKSLEWNRLREEIERDGLEAVETRLTTWWERVRADKDPRHSASASPPAVFLLDAIYDEEAIKREIARELKGKVEREIEAKSTFPLRVIYLQHLRDHLGNVLGEAADLEEYEVARETIETQLERLELEYGRWISDAIVAQED